MFLLRVNIIYEYVNKIMLTFENKKNVSIFDVQGIWFTDKKL